MDLNPFQDPYRREDLVVRALDRVGWTWGGTFRSVLDLHHLSATGR